VIASGLCGMGGAWAVGAVVANTSRPVVVSLRHRGRTQLRSFRYPMVIRSWSVAEMPHRIAGEEFLHQCEHRAWIKNGKSVEGDGLHWDTAATGGHGCTSDKETGNNSRSQPDNCRRLMVVFIAPTWTNESAARDT